MKTVALIYGGEGFEHDISVKSAKHLKALINTEKYKLICIFIDKNGSWYLTGGAELDSAEVRLVPTYPVRLDGVSGFFTNERIIAVDAAIPCLHGDFGEDGVIAGALTAAHIPYIGQDTFAAAFTADKAAAKLAAEHLSIPTARWLASSEVRGDIRAEAEAVIGYPMFIKPTRLGSSFGAHPVFDGRDLEAALDDARSFSESIIIEEYIKFDYEVECAYLESDKPLLAPHGRILSDGFYGYREKYGTNAAKTDTAPGFDGRTEEKIKEYADRLVCLLGLRYLSRLDFFVTRGGDVYFNEINTFPGMTESSLYPALCERIGQGEFINALIERASNAGRI